MNVERVFTEEILGGEGVLCLRAGKVNATGASQTLSSSRRAALLTSAVGQREEERCCQHERGP